ncbi:cullin domain-containing protein [Cryptosporidium ubiquitum]|uniref:Cullin domain-containing protein n=1 Tax=Cryptosporidium ubiquitum TaxID=857276 RepID=A0A1J4MIN0_9CRYT|nr:cullin domain-containing protein [Cryptosporidium ubiquitum]OII73323.1 cullin domain-containing protein [Cryptosporidium ubiquitum]
MHLENPRIQERGEEDFENEIEFFLVKLYEINNEEEATSCKINSFKRMKLIKGSEFKKVNLERTRRLVTHLCNHGQYQFLYDTFKKNYFEVWTGNMQIIQQHELLSTIQSKVQKISGSLELTEFIYNALFDQVDTRELAKNGILNDYLSMFTRFWCHHKRSTQIICNVYLTFDCMYKRYRAALSDLNKENEYLGFVQNANSFLKSIILCPHPTTRQPQITEYLPISLVGTLLSLFVFLNEIRDFSHTCSISISEGLKKAVRGKYEKTFFMLRKTFEMFIGLEIINEDLKNLYLEILRRYYLKILEVKKSLGFKDFVNFVRESLEFEKSLLVTPNNKNLIFSNIESSESKLGTSLLSFINQDQKIPLNVFGDSSSSDISSFLQHREYDTSWDLFVFKVELNILEVLVSDEIIQYYSKINQGRSCFTMLVANEEFEILTFLFNVFKRKNKEQLFRKELERCIVEQGFDLVRQLTKYRFLDPSEMKDCRRTSFIFKTYLENLKGLLELYLKVERIWRKSFIEDEKIRNLCINEAWVQILNYNDTLAKEIMRGFSLLIHHILVKSYYFHEGDNADLRSGGTQKKLSRVNLDIINWTLNPSSGNSLEEASTGYDIKTREYFESIIYLFKCSNFKEYFQKYYHQLLSQRIVYYFTNNRIGFGGDQREIFKYYYGWSKSPALDNNIEMLMNKVDIYEIYLMKLLYNECGYTFINKSNFVIKDWFACQSIFKFYLLESIGHKMVPSINNARNCHSEPLSLKENINTRVNFGGFSQRKKKIMKSLNSPLCEEIHSWLKSEDLKIRFEASSLDCVGLTENDEGDFVISSGIPLEIQKSQENEELGKEIVLRNIQYDVPFSLIVLSSTNWPLRNFNNVTDGAKNSNILKEQNYLLNFLECELFSEQKENLDIQCISNEMQLYQQFYTKIYSRTLTWSYFLGTCILDYCMHANWRQRLKMILTLQQGVLLLCFNEKNSVGLSGDQYLVLKDNIDVLFNASKLLIVQIGLEGEVIEGEIDLPPLLKLHEEYRGQDNVRIEYNVDFDIAIRTQIESGKFDQSSEYLLNYASGLNTMDFSSDFNLDYIYKEKDYLDENMIKNQKGGTEEEQYSFEYDNLNSNNYTCLFKNNKYRIEAIIMKFLKHKQKSPLLNIIQVVMKELSLNKDDSGDSIQDNKIISGEILKILNSLIQRDLIEIDSENEQFYNYIP